MVDVSLAEYHRLIMVSHQSLRHLKHTVHKYIIFEVLPHLGDINHATSGQFLELGIVDIGPVHCCLADSNSAE